MGDTLTTEDFSAYFRALWGDANSPYIWQAKTLCWIDDNRRFPTVLPVPTGGGKTAMLDIALFALALDSQRPVADRWAPRRIALVVDRRVVVDQAGFRGAQIAKKIRDAREGVLAKVRETLSTLSADVPVPAADDLAVVNATVLRGGIARDERWSERPDIPSLIASTIDQVGSRLLFRGYGMGRGARPIHAGLLGNDILLLLDEVHLATAFADTLDRLRDRRIEHPGEDLERFYVCELSATPRQRSGGRPLEAIRPNDVWDDPKLEPRMSARKVIRLADPVTAKGKGADVSAVAERAVSELDVSTPIDSTTCAAVIVNSVAQAVSVFERLKESTRWKPFLITGRMRAYEREEKLQVSVNSAVSTATLDEYLRDRTKRTPEHGNVVVVSTQCLEAGADYDFDVLVTECASIDALIQRFGRLDRAGDLTASGSDACAVVFISEHDLEPERAHPVYGEALRKTWDALRSLADGTPDGRLNGGLRGDLQALVDSDNFGQLRPIPSRAPILLPAHLDLFVATNPEPLCAPDESLWLHGLERHVPEVTVVWREEITMMFLDWARKDDNRVSAVESVQELLRLTAPSSPESLTVPRYALSTLLKFNPAADSPVSDVESVRANAVDETRGTLFVWDGDEVRLSRVDDIKAGEVVVLPAAMGGLGLHGSWDATSTDPVLDIAEVAVQRSTRKMQFLRLSERALLGFGVKADWLESNPVPSLEHEDDEDDQIDVIDWVRDLVGAHNVDRFVHLKEALAKSTIGVGFVEFHGCDPILVLTFGRFALELDAEDELAEAPSFTGQQASLRSHLSGVGTWARQLGSNVGLSEHLVDDLELAGRLHDLGKADPRFQAWLNDGAPVVGELLAKSGSRRRSQLQREQVRRQAGYPKGARHEMLSLELIERCVALREKAHDWDLVCHLVTTHHGYCRPQAKGVHDQRPVTVGVLLGEAIDGLGGFVDASSGHRLARFDSGIILRFDRVIRRYGWYRTAWLEAILRLADHRRSEQEADELSGERAR